MTREMSNYYRNPSRAGRLQRIFTKEAAMFYGVRKEGVNPKQCEINNYIRYSPDSAPPERIGNEASLDVATYLQLPDAVLHHYVHKETVCRLQNHHATPEFMIRMPLPHRIGTTLPFLTTAKPKAQAKEKKKAGEEGVQEPEEEESEEEQALGNGKNHNDNAFPPGRLTLDEDWLEENDPDGVIRSQILLKPRNFSLPALNRPMGPTIRTLRPKRTTLLPPRRIVPLGSVTI